MLAHLLLSFTLLNPQSALVPGASNPLEVSPEMRAYLDKKVDREAEPMIRLQNLVTMVFRDNELNFTYSGETRSAIETFSNRNGNCLSFTILFISMARYLGLDAKFREVEIAPTWSKNGIFINLNQHVNAAVFINGLTYAVDVFPAINRLEIGARAVTDARGIAHFYNNKGVDELGQGNVAGAEDHLKRALELDPTIVGAWINLGAAKMQSGQFAEAEKFYRRALEIDRRHPAAMSNLASLYQLTGRTKEANRLQLKVKEFREKNPYHHYYLGLQAFDEGRYQEAIEEYRKALKLKRGEHNFYFAMARAYGQLGKNSEMASNLQLAQKYAPDPSNKALYSQKLELLKGIRSPAP